MEKLKIILNNQWFFPVIVLYYGIFYILFGERYPFNGGLSTDGLVFASFMPDFTKSVFFDIYYVHRILPSLLVSIFLKPLSVSPTAQNICTAFQILNVASIIITCYFIKQILLLFKVSLKNQLLAFTLLLLNFGVIKYPFYLPVMTDKFSLMLSTVLLYFYLKKNISGLIIFTLLSAFASPMVYYQGLLLIAFPICILPFTPLLKWQRIFIYGIPALYILAISVFFVYIKNIDVTIDYVARIDRNLLPLSILGLVLLYFFFARIFSNKSLLNYSLFLKKINYKMLLISFGVFLAVNIIIYFLHPNPIARYPITITGILSGPAIYSLIKPFISIVAHTSYWGIIVCLLLLFWSSFCKTLSQMGWGIVAAFLLNLFLFGLVPETRVLTNLLPWLIVFLIITLNKYSFSKSFYIVAGLLSFAASKIWLLLNIYDSNSTKNLDENGCIGFPAQLLWMNTGLWMSEQMYYVQGGVMILFTGILFFMLYKVEVDKYNKLHIIPKFKVSK